MSGRSTIFDGKLLYFGLHRKLLCFVMKVVNHILIWIPLLWFLHYLYFKYVKFYYSWLSCLLFTIFTGVLLTFIVRAALEYSSTHMHMCSAKVQRAHIHIFTTDFQKIRRLSVKKIATMRFSLERSSCLTCFLDVAYQETN